MNRWLIPRPGDTEPADRAEDDNIRRFAQLDRLSHDIDQAAARRAEACRRLGRYGWCASESRPHPTSLFLLSAHSDPRSKAGGRRWIGRRSVLSPAPRKGWWWPATTESTPAGKDIDMTRVERRGLVTSAAPDPNTAVTGYPAMNRRFDLRVGDTQAADGAEDENIRHLARLDRLAHDIDEAAREADAYRRLEGALLSLHPIGLSAPASPGSSQSSAGDSKGGHDRGSDGRS